MKPTERYRSPSDLPTTIPVFPLRGAIVLPRAVLPLNIFEPRYLAMLDHVISGDRLLGIIQPDDQPAPVYRPPSNDDADADDHERAASSDSPEGKETALHPVGCVGRVTSFQELDDGRLVISLTGISRFRVREECETNHAFRVCDVDFSAYAHDLEPGLGERQVDREQLLSVLRNYLESRALNADWRMITRSGSEFLVNSLSVVSPYGPAEKQALLEACDLKTRAEVLIALAEMDLAGGDDGTGSTLQ
ncbi:MAG: LON peptidase substrate-binding domain-containing protein [Pseudomonadota bacterium]